MMNPRQYIISRLPGAFAHRVNQKFSTHITSSVCREELHCHELYLLWRVFHIVRITLCLVFENSSMLRIDNEERERHISSSG